MGLVRFAIGNNGAVWGVVIGNSFLGDPLAGTPIDLGNNNTWNLRNQINFGQTRMSFFDDKPPLPARTTNADIHQLGLATGP